MFTRFQSALPTVLAPSRTNIPFPSPIPIFAKWTGYVDGPPATREDFLSKAHAYTAMRRPTEPLALGMMVKLYATSPASYCTPDAPSDLYHAYDAHIVGKITRIAGWRGTAVGLEIQNECWNNAVRKVRLEIPYIPDVTVRRLAHLRAGKGPREAREDAITSQPTVMLPPDTWKCGMRWCATREPGQVREGVLYVYTQTPTVESQTKPPRKKRRSGHLHALGWLTEDGTQYGLT